jgi:hypothetical protein
MGVHASSSDILCYSSSSPPPSQRVWYSHHKILVGKSNTTPRSLPGGRGVSMKISPCIKTEKQNKVSRYSAIILGCFRVNYLCFKISLIKAIYTDCLSFYILRTNRSKTHQVIVRLISI